MTGDAVDHGGGCREVWVMPSDRAAAFIRARNRSTEPASHRARTPAISDAAVGVGDIGVGERDRRASLAGPERVVTEHEVGRHHLRHAGDCGRVLVRAGVDLRLACHEERGLAIFRPHGAGQRFAMHRTVLTAKDADG
jgi:hypothetical protein